MTWLIDTNIISEVRKGPRCHPAVTAWWAGVEDRDLFLSALALGKICKGIEGGRPRDPGRAAALEGWLLRSGNASGLSHCLAIGSYGGVAEGFFSPAVSALNCCCPRKIGQVRLS